MTRFIPKVVLIFFFCNFGPPLSLNSCYYSTRRSHQDSKSLTVPPFHSSFYKLVKYFGHSFIFDVPKICSDLLYYVCSATTIISFPKKLKACVFAKAYPPYPPCHSCFFFGMTWLYMWIYDNSRFCWVFFVVVVVLGVFFFGGGGWGWGWGCCCCSMEP